MCFVGHASMAQNDSAQIALLPFSAQLSISSDMDSMSVLFLKDSLFLLAPIETLDTSQKRKLIGMQIEHTVSGQFMQTDYDQNSTYRAKEPTQTITWDTLSAAFGLNKSGVFEKHKLTISSMYDSYEWTPFSLGELLVIKKCDAYFGSMRSGTTTYAYYFEEIAAQNGDSPP